MESYIPQEITSRYTARNILLKAINMHLGYYRQQGLAATILSDIKDNCRSLSIAYFMQEIGSTRPKRRKIPMDKDHDPVESKEFIEFAMEEFEIVADMIRTQFRNTGKTIQILNEYYGYFSEVCVPILMCGDYDGSMRWNHEYNNSVD